MHEQLVGFKRQFGAQNTGFDWELTDPSELNGFQDAVFVVKQANPNSPNNVEGVAWVAYLFQNITDSMGTFFTETNFTCNTNL